MLTLSTLLLVARGVYCDYGPVSLDKLDPMTLSWNQIHWLVRDQIKEVEEIKKEHDSIYNQLTGCYGLEKCLGEFGLLNIESGSKLYQLGLRVVETHSDLTRHREVVNGGSNRLEAELRERTRQDEYQARQSQQASERAEEEIRRLRLEEERLRAEEDRLRLEEERLREANRVRQESRQSSSSSYRSGSTYSRSGASSSSSSTQWSNAGSAYEPGQDTESSWTSYFSNQTAFGPKPPVYEHGYKYSSGRGR